MPEKLPDDINKANPAEVPRVTITMRGLWKGVSNSSWDCEDGNDDIKNGDDIPTNAYFETVDEDGTRHKSTPYEIECLFKKNSSRFEQTREK